MSRQPPTDIVGYAQDAQKEWKVPSSVSLAQWIIESGWGAHCPGNNPFGMKPRKGKNDPCQQLMTTEVLGGKTVRVSQPFRTFPSQKEAFAAHAELLATAPVYAAAIAKLPDRNAFIDEMARHYATDPAYATKIKGMIKSQELDKYDV